jgi:hypothetical protein
MYYFTKYKYLLIIKTRLIMRIINLNESQFSRLFNESDGDSIFLDGNDTTSRFGSEVPIQAIVTNQNGEEKTSNPINTDKFSKQQTPQQWGSVGGRKSANTI